MKISIIIPVYNGARYIENCLNSVYNQGLNNDCFEILAVNDGSTDDSEEIIEAYAQKVDNINLINKKNGGVSSARNVGIDSAQGDFVLFLDADDELVDGSLPSVYDYLCKNTDIDMLITKQSRFNGMTERVVNNASCLKENIVYSGAETYKYGYVRGTAGGAICRTKFLRETGLLFPTGIKNGEDTVFFGLVHVYAQKVVFLNVVLYQINEIKGSASRADYDKVGLNCIETLNRFIEIRNNGHYNPEQKGVIEYVTYRILSMLTSHFVKSKALTYSQLRKRVDFDSLLPLETKYMYMMRQKAHLINTSYLLFYLLSYLDKKCNKFKRPRKIVEN